MGRFSTGDDDWGVAEGLEMTVGGGERLEMTVELVDGWRWTVDGGGGGGGGESIGEESKKTHRCVCVFF